MLSGLVNLITKSINTTAFKSNTIKTQNQYALQKTAEKSSNPFAQSAQSNPFLTTTFAQNADFHKNQPVKGGYFAGYYNGKPNIVGQKLFIEA